MGTRSLTIFNDEWKNEEIVVFYRQYDGYPEGHGTELLTFIDNMKIVNGISLYKNEKIANGMGCLAAQVISHFKEETGKFYLYSAGTRDVGEEFIYTLYYTEELKIKVQDTYDGEDNVIFDGNTKEYKDWINLELNPKNQNKKKEDECFFI